MRERTGLVLDPYFSGTKIEWLLRNVEGAERAVFGTIDSWLLFKLTGRHATDYTNASRTMLFDIRRLAWDEELCAMLGVDPARLPEPLPSAHVYGTTSEFGGEVPVAGIAGDQQAALFGQACHGPARPRTPTAPAASSCSTPAASAPEPSRGPADHGRLRPGEEAAYALEASIFVTGAAVQWLRDGLGIDRARRRRARRWRPRYEGNDGVYFVPALTGLGSPHWDPYARGTIVGLTRGSGRAHLARAALEAIAYQTVDAVRAQEAAAAERLEVLKADGGAVANRWLMQFQADVLGAPVVVPEIAETTALGAAYLAGIATGRWSAEQVGRDVARGRALRAEDGRGRARGSARRVAPRAGALARLGRLRATGAGDLQGRNRSPAAGGTHSDGRASRRLPTMSEHQATGLQGRPSRGVLRSVPRVARKGVGWTYPLVRR